ncbi:MAG: hypothetical protein CMG93_06480, partial [Marinomonas sp.]|nr:hypothetical protein [Marinomonas sp.]
MSDNQQTFVTLGEPVGFVTQISGPEDGFVRATSIDGQDRVLRIGDPIYPGEELVSIAGGTITITFTDGTDLLFADSVPTSIDDEVFGLADADESEEEAFVSDGTSELDALQQAILAGQDPTLNQEAPAAGETAEEDGGTDTTADIQRSGQQATPTYGYDTSAASEEDDSALFTSEEETPAVAAAITDTATAGTVSVDDITSDDVINASEAAGTVTVTGTATGGDIATGDTVTLEINGNTYTTTVAAGGAWSVDVAGSDLAADTAFDAVVTSSDAAGNTVESIGSSTHTIDSSPLSINLDIDPITDDSILNASEAGGDVVVTGSVSGDDFDSGTVTLTINGVEYTGELTDGSFSISVAGSDLEADSDSIVDASVTVSNSIGQTGEANSTEAYFVDTSARATIRVDSITSDDVINAEEASSTITVTGRVGFDASAGDTVTMEINGTTYTATVQANKTWSVDVAGSDLAADTSFVASVSGTDSAGNSYSASTTSTHTVDLAATAGTVTVDAITADDVINNAESGQ